MSAQFSHLLRVTHIWGEVAGKRVAQYLFRDYERQIWLYRAVFLNPNYA